MTDLSLPPIEEIDVDDLVLLPRGYRYELHDGNLVIMTPSTFWHKEMAWRLMLMHRMVGARAFQDPGVKGDRPRDCRLPDVGVVTKLPPNTTTLSNLPGSAYSLVIEIVSPGSVNGEYTEKAAWYAERGIPEYWIVEQTPDRDGDDALVSLHRLVLAGGQPPAYLRERTVLLSDLEAEFIQKRPQ